jgi:Protein of unknown function (DUF2852)
MGNCSWAADRFRGFRPLELVAMILGFVFWWPLGLAILVFKLCGGELPRFAGPQWQSGSWPQGPWAQASWANGASARRGWQPSSSGNVAFEEYKRATLDRLEAERRSLAEEERAFADFLRELRTARDREEFDRFMQSRRQQSEGQGPAQG